MKKAISILLLMTTLLGCCSIFFSCKKDKDNTSGVKTLDNKSEVVLDITSAGLPSGESKGDVPTVKWNLKKNSNDRILKLDFSKSLADYKEISFWVYNPSDEYVEFEAYILTTDKPNDGYRVQTDVDNPWVERLISSGWGNKVDMTHVNTLMAQPGWHQITIPLDEVAPLSGQNRVDYTWDADKNKANVKFDKSTITGIKINASQAYIENDVTLHISSISANSNKYGTIKGFGIKKISDSVCFYKESNFYLYNQLRYCLDYNSEASVGSSNDSVFVPIAVLAEHRRAAGANIDIKVNTKEEVTFIYNGETKTFKAGDEYTYTANARGYNAGATMKGTTSSIGEYLTVPMEVAASALGYNLFYDTTGLAIFTDRKTPEQVLAEYKSAYPQLWSNKTINDLDWTDWEYGEDKDDMLYVDPMDTNYYEEDLTDTIPGRQLGYIAQIIKVINFDYYTGKDLLDDMDKLHGKDGHGKLIITDAQIEELKILLETDSVYKAWFTSFETEWEVGSANYSSKLPTWGTSDGDRLSQDGATDIPIYAFLYRVTGNEDYAERVVKLMSAFLNNYKDPVTGVKTWNTGEYLSCATIIQNYAIGYDWCYDYIAKDESTLKKIENGAWTHCYAAILGFGDQFEWWLDKKNVQDYNKKNQEDDNPNTVNSPWSFINVPYMAFDNSKRSDIAIPNESLRYKIKYDSCQFNGNWSAVCNGAVSLAAFAFANINAETRAASEYILTLSVNDITYAMVDCYAPDGGHPEGPGYWYYGTKDQMLFNETLYTCTGSYHGLDDFQGFEDSYNYVIGLGSNDSAWPYHDSDSSTDMPIVQFFIAAKMFNNPSLAQFKYNQIISSNTYVSIWDLAFYNPETCYENNNLTLNLDYISYKIGMVTFRSDWTDNQMFCGLHGGANNAGHGQLDIGNFILEYGGTRFFTDLGTDTYSMPGYFSFPERHWIYVNRAEGHNTLVINPAFVDMNYNRSNSSIVDWGEGGQYVDVWKCDFYQRTNDTSTAVKGMKYDQSYSAISNILAYRTAKNSAFAVVDMGCAYKYYDVSKTNENGATNFVTPTGIRGILVTDNRSTVIIQDEMDLTGFSDTTNEVLWQGHIVNGGSIKVSDDGQAALITFNGKTLLCEIVTPENYGHTWKFESRSADYLRETGLFLQPGEKSRDGKQKLVATASVDSDLRIAVVCKLLSSGPHNYTWTDIADWENFIA